MSTTSAIGMNLAGVDYWETEYPFIDRMKSAGIWGANGIDPASVPLDANGYPTAMPAGTSNLWTMVSLDPASLGHDNTYVLTYDGTATFQAPGCTVVSSQPGKLVFQYAGTGLLPLIVSELDPNAPLTNMHLIQQSQQQLFASGEIFNPAFTDKIGAFDTLRYMGWGNTNDSNATSWSTRTTVDDRTWGLDTKDGTVPIEVMVALANKTHTNMWLNIPTQGDDDYVRQMMTYVRDHLDPALKVSLEYSNEVWNWSFQQSRYAGDMANKLWATDSNGDGTIEAAEAVEGGWMEYYGYRSAQIASIANEVFAGAPSDRLHNVISTQTAYLGLEGYAFNGVARANLGSASTLFDDYAITTYFGDELRGATDTDRATILSWARAGDAGVSAAINDIAHGGTLSGQGSLVALASVFAYQASVAAKNGLKLVAYEGGVDFGAYNFSEAERPEITAFLAKVQADPRMGDLYTQLIAKFAEAGGTLNTFLADAAADAIYGNYGTLKSIYDAPTPAWQALVDAEARHRASQGSGGTIYEAAPEVTLWQGIDRSSRDTNLPAGSAQSGVATTSTLTSGLKNGVDDVLTGGGAPVRPPRGGSGAQPVGVIAAGLPIGSDPAGVAITSTLSNGVNNAVDNVLTGGGAPVRPPSGVAQPVGVIAAGLLIGSPEADALVVSASSDVTTSGLGGVVTAPTSQAIDAPRTIPSVRTLGGGVDKMTYADSATSTGAAKATTDVPNVRRNENAMKWLDEGMDADRLVVRGRRDTVIGVAGSDAHTAGFDGDALGAGGGAEGFDWGSFGRTATTVAKVFDYTASEPAAIDMSAFDAVADAETKTMFQTVATSTSLQNAVEPQVTRSFYYANPQEDLNRMGVADFTPNAAKTSLSTGWDFL